MGRRQLLSDAIANVQFRLRGATRRGVGGAARPDRRVARGDARARPGAPRRRTCWPGILPRVYPQMLTLAYEHQDAGRRAYIVTAAAQDLAEILAQVMALRRRDRLEALRGRRRRLHRPPAGAVRLRLGKAQAISELAAREGIDLDGLLRLLGLGVRSADAAGGRPSGRGQSGHGPGAARARRRAGRCCALTGSGEAEDRRRPDRRGGRRRSWEARRWSGDAPARLRAEATAGAASRPLGHRTCQASAS